MTIKLLATWKWLLLILIIGCPSLPEFIGIDQVSPAIAQEPSRSTPLAEANRLLQQGTDQYQASEFQVALESLEKALEIYREIKNQQGEADALASLGYVYLSQGNYSSAIDFYNQHITVTRAIINSEGLSDSLIKQEAASLSQIGDIYRFMEKFHFSVDSFEQALMIMPELDERDLLAEGYLLNSQGVSFQLLGQFLRAQENHEVALSIAREYDDKTLEANSLGNLAIIHNALGNDSLATSLRTEHLDIAIEMENRHDQAKVLNNLGADYLELAEYSDAIDHFRQALDLSREVDSYETEIVALTNLGRGYAYLRQYENAFDYFQKALTITQENNFRGSEVDVLNAIGSLHLFLNNAAQADEIFWKALPIVESLRDSSLPDEFKISLFDLQSTTYEGLEQALIFQARAEEALEISERRRARAFADLLSQRISNQQTDPLISVPLNLAEIQKTVQRNQSVLVEYSLIEWGPESSIIYIWVVQPDGKVNFRRVSLENKTRDLSSLVTGSREAIGIRHRGGFDLVANQLSKTDQLSQLHQLLIEPIADLLPTDPEQRVVFIPQGPLFLVPFPALLDADDTHLIEKHTILTAPSIQVLNLSQQQRRSQTFTTSPNGQDLLLIGNPDMPEVWHSETADMRKLSDLPGAEQEAKEIAAFFNTTALLHENATEAVVKQRIGEARIVHLATHGLLEYGAPEESGVRDVPGAIALTPGGGEDGLLTSAEILEELDLNAELVVLSACDTGLGEITGDGVIGLSRSLIAAGTPSVIVSLWSVPDAPTAELMTEFYRQLQQGQDKAQALRQAMLETMKTNPDPVDWAAFTLIGTAE